MNTQEYQTYPMGQWRAVSGLSAPRPWRLYCQGIPMHPAQFTSTGLWRRFATFAAAQRAADKLNITHPGRGEDDPAVTYSGDGDGSHSPYCECHQCMEGES